MFEQKEQEQSIQLLAFVALGMSLLQAKRILKFPTFQDFAFEYSKKSFRTFHSPIENQNILFNIAKKNFDYPNNSSLGKGTVNNLSNVLHRRNDPAPLNPDWKTVQEVRRKGAETLNKIFIEVFGKENVQKISAILGCKDLSTSMKECCHFTNLFVHYGLRMNSQKHFPQLRKAPLPFYTINGKEIGTKECVEIDSIVSSARPDHASRIHGVFTEITLQCGFGPLSQIQTSALLAWCREKAFHSLVDVGAGNGRNVQSLRDQLLRNQGENLTIFGIDSFMQAAFRKKFALSEICRETVLSDLVHSGDLEEIYQHLKTNQGTFISWPTILDSEVLLDLEKKLPDSLRTFMYSSQRDFEKHGKLCPMDLIEKTPELKQFAIIPGQYWAQRIGSFFYSKQFNLVKSYLGELKKLPFFQTLLPNSDLPVNKNRIDSIDAFFNDTESFPQICLSVLPDRILEQSFLRYMGNQGWKLSKNHGLHRFEEHDPSFNRTLFFFERD